MKNKLILFDECGYNGNEDVSHFLGEYRLSAIKSIDEFEKTYELMSKRFNFNKTYEEFINIYKKVFENVDYYKDVAEYEISLKKRCKVGILSNLTIFDKERLDKQVNLSQYDYVFLSFEMGTRKPDMEIYEQVQSKVPFKPKDILFIDDRKDNIESASLMGWNTFQVTGLELDKIKQRCEEFLNEENINKK